MSSKLVRHDVLKKGTAHLIRFALCIHMLKSPYRISSAVSIFQSRLDTVDRYAPNFRASVVGRRALSPQDLEREFGLVGGDIFHGALTLDQLFAARPVLGHGRYRAPIPGLYLCGSGTHPGGGVTGVPGHNAAREILRDLRRRRDR